MRNEDLLSLCTQMTGYIIVDHTLRYLLALPLVFSTFVVIYILKKTHDRINLYRNIEKTLLPRKLASIIKKHQLNSLEFQVVKSKKFISETIGIFSPKIVISDRLINTIPHDQLEAVVLHEFFHLKHSHTFIKLMTQTVQSIFFFFPVVGDVMKYIQILLETSADEYAVSTLHSKLPLRNALANLMQRNVGKTSFATAFVRDGRNARYTYLAHNRYPGITLARKSLLTTSTSIFFLLMIWSTHLTLGKIVDSSLVGKQLRSSCSFFQCVANCQQTVKLYSENKLLSQ